MIKLEDLIRSSYSNIIIMDDAFETLNINGFRLDFSYLSKKLLDSEVDRIEAKDEYIKVWLKEENENG